VGGGPAVFPLAGPVPCRVAGLVRLHPLVRAPTRRALTPIGKSWRPLSLPTMLSGVGLSSDSREALCMSDNESTILPRHLDRLRLGDLSARDELLARAYARLQAQVVRMLGQFPGVRRWEDADDVSNNAAMRLWKALEVAKPATALHFYRLAALQVRR